AAPRPHLRRRPHLHGDPSRDRRVALDHHEGGGRTRGYSSHRQALDCHYRPHGQLRLHHRPPHSHHARRRHWRRLPHPPLLRRLHGARGGLLAFLRLPQPLHVLHVGPCSRQKLSPHVRRLGG